MNEFVGIGVDPPPKKISRYDIVINKIKKKITPLFNSEQKRTITHPKHPSDFLGRWKTENIPNTDTSIENEFV